MREAVEKLTPYTLEGHIGRMKCPYLIVHGGYDVLGVAQARRVYDAAKDAGVDATLRDSSMRRRPAPTIASTTTPPSARRYSPTGWPKYSKSTSAI